MIAPLLLGSVELAVKLAPVIAQAAVDVVTVIHEHLQKTPAQASAVGLPFRDVLNQRRQAQAGASHGTVTGPTVAKPQPSPGR